MATHTTQTPGDRAEAAGISVSPSRWAPISARTFRELGQVTYVDTGFAPPEGEDPKKQCRSEKLIDFAASGRTGANGTVTRDIQQVFCAPIDIDTLSKIWITASPRGKDPVYLTHQVLAPFDPPGPAQPDADAFRVIFYAWDKAGKPKANVSFTWRALIVVFDPPID